jgi:hypothetical protein
MTLRPSILACAVLVAVSCKHQPARLPAWVQGAPPNAVFALSGGLGWTLRQPTFQATIAKTPMVEHILDVFLKQARINPATETGRLSLFLLGGLRDVSLDDPRTVQALGTNFLLALSDFKDPKALFSAMAEAFPPEGSLVVGGREYPLHVVMDINEWHVRAMLDDRGQVWLGDLRTLVTLTQRTPLPPSLTAAAAWMTPGATLQGFALPKQLLPKSLPGALSDRNPMRDLPQGIEAAAFSASQVPGRTDAYRFELVLAGPPRGIQEALPWVNRILAAASALQGGQGLPAPELLQEKGRLALRCPMTQEQIQTVVDRLGGGQKGLPPLRGL